MEKYPRYAYCFALDGRNIWVYAYSESEARRKYKRWYHKDAGELIERARA